MMRSNPLVSEVLAGLGRPGKAQLDCLGMLALQALVVFLWWPKGSVAPMLESEHGPRVLTAVVLALGITTAYFALRAGTAEIVLPGQHALRDWARHTSLSPGRMLRGHVRVQLVLCLYLSVLSSPLLAMAFTVSGGEWAALGWCLAATLVQALFYGLCGAVTQFAMGQHHAQSRFVARTLLVVIYVPVGWLVPVTSHVAFTTRAFGEDRSMPPTFPAVPDHVAFLAIYTGLTLLAAFALHRLLLRERRHRADRHEAAAGHDGEALGEAAAP